MSLGGWWELSSLWLKQVVGVGRPKWRSGLEGVEHVCAALACVPFAGAPQPGLQ